MSVTSARIVSTSQRSIPDRFRIQAGNLLIRGLFDGIALDDLLAIFARALEFWMRKRGLKGMDVARELGVSQASVSRWLNGVGGTDFVILASLAKLLEIPGWYFLHDRPEELPDPKAGGKHAAPDEVDQALQALARRLGKQVVIRPLKKA